MNQHYIKRQLAEKLKDLFANFPVVVIGGARQVGKTTLVKETFPNIPLVEFDPNVDVENARADPDLFLKNRNAPLILDEIQYAPQLAPAIKRKIDEISQPGQYLITGSRQWEVMKHLSESLAGRAVFLDLESFSLSEIAEVTSGGWLEKWLTGKTSKFERLKLPFPIYEQLRRGFMPKAQFLPSNLLADFHSSYQRTYIERDIRVMAEVSDLDLFSRFFRLCTALTAQEVNHSEFGRDIGVTPQTASRWLNILKATFQWVEIPAYSGNTIKRISSKPKGYINDTGFVCFSQAISSSEVLGGHPLWGSIFETAVLNDIRKQCRFISAKPNLYHWRSHSGAEIDILLEWNGKFYPIEIKGKTHPSKNDARGIEAFKKTYPKLNISKGLIVSPSDSFYQIADDIFVMPWDAA